MLFVSSRQEVLIHQIKATEIFVAINVVGLVNAAVGDKTGSSRNRVSVTHVVDLALGNLAVLANPRGTSGTLVLVSLRWTALGGWDRLTIKAADCETRATSAIVGRHKFIRSVRVAIAPLPVQEGIASPGYMALTIGVPVFSFIDLVLLDGFLGNPTPGTRILFLFGHFDAKGNDE